MRESEVQTGREEKRGMNRRCQLVKRMTGWRHELKAQIGREEGGMSQRRAKGGMN